MCKFRMEACKICENIVIFSNKSFCLLFIHPVYIAECFLSHDALKRLSGANGRLTAYYKSNEEDVLTGIRDIARKVKKTFGEFAAFRQSRRKRDTGSDKILIFHKTM